MRIPIIVTVNNEEFKASMAPSWAEVTMKEMIELSELTNEANTLDVIAILTGIPKDTISNAKVESIESIVPFLNWTNTAFDFQMLDVPKTVEIMGVEYRVPDDLGLKSYGQKISIEQDMAKQGNALRMMVKILATYFQPIVLKADYDGDAAELFETNILQMKAVEAYPVATFFLLRFHASYSMKGKHSQKSLTGLKKWLASKGWWRSGILQPLTTLRVETQQSMNKS